MQQIYFKLSTDIVNMLDEIVKKESQNSRTAVFIEMIKEKHKKIKRISKKV